MAAMAGDVDDLVPFLGQLTHLLCSVDREAAIELVPQPAEKLSRGGSTDRRNWRRSRPCSRGRFLRLLQADPFPSGLLLDGLLDHARIQQLLEQQVAVRQLGPGGGQLLAAEVGAGHPRRLWAMASSVPCLSAM